jgi:hypothetical protein
MIHSATHHLSYQFGVALADAMHFDQLVFDESSNGFFADQSPHQHMDFDMLSQQVLAAHLARIDHPHPHEMV